jgi:hypothetical protein
MPSQYEPENWRPEYALLEEGDFKMIGGLKWPLTQADRDEIAAQEADWQQDVADEEAAEVLRLENEAILQLKKDSEYILTLVGKDDAWVDTKIDSSTSGANNAEIVENIRTALKEITYTQRDVADILTALYNLGRI